MTRDQVLRRIEVRRGDFVIDIGGGHRPFPRTDLVIEKYPFEHSLHRIGPMQFSRVPVIQADAHSLPVPDGGCDLIFASHIIEHLDDPQRFISEIKRCSRSVYLEFPSRNRELMLAWSFHKWFVEARGTVLKFYRNDLPQLFGPLFHAEHDAALGAWSEARHELLNTSIWCRSGDIECEFPNETAGELVFRDSPRGDSRLNFAEFIHRTKYSLREVAAFAAQSMLSSAMYTKLTRPRGKNHSSPAPLPDSVLTRLMCLRCRSCALHRAGDEIACGCGARYFQDRGIFDFDLRD
jgi:SAM-dependent methyltransferase